MLLVFNLWEMFVPFCYRFQIILKPIFWVKIDYFMFTALVKVKDVDFNKCQ